MASRDIYPSRYCISSRYYCADDPVPGSDYTSKLSQCKVFAAVAADAVVVAAAAVVAVGLILPSL